jgi:uncharacterized protein (TIGR02145 family)
MIKKRCFAFSKCKPDEPVDAEPETSTMTDAEGNVYITVKIGNQWWMAENLAATKYNDGTPIAHYQTDTAKWNNDTVGAYCTYDNFLNPPGLLYNFYAVTNAAKLAPSGWHIPTDAEWKTLEIHLGMTSGEAEKVNFRGTNQADALKQEGSNAWSPYSGIWSTNETGFSALAGNCRMFDGVWGDPFGFSYTGFWWTGSNHSEEKAWHMDYKKSNVFRHHGLKTYGFSVRCVKD